MTPNKSFDERVRELLFTTLKKSAQHGYEGAWGVGRDKIPEYVEEAINALDTLYREKYIGMLPKEREASECDCSEDMCGDAIIMRMCGCKVDDFNTAIRQVRERFSEVY